MGTDQVGPSMANQIVKQGQRVAEFLPTTLGELSPLE